MNSCAHQESVSTHTDLNVNKCALKLVGFEFGDFTDEELLEFISYYVPPAAIKALFYDSYNSFYVLHLSDIEFTSVLIGKTLRFGTHHISFLPLLDCFVIGNVYPSLSNSDISKIFSVFGKVFDVTNHHVLPNSSKFFHVLSGTRAISFLLTGCESEVQIPKNVVHSPYIFHTQHLCLGCQTQGHSHTNCPEKVEEIYLPVQSCSSVDNNLESTIEVENVKTVKLLQFEKLVDDNLSEKPAENSQLQKKEENSLLEGAEEYSQLQKHEENNFLEKAVENRLGEKSAESILSEANSIEAGVSVGKDFHQNILDNKSLGIETDISEEKPPISLLDEEIRKIVRKKQKGRVKMSKQARKALAKKNRNSLPDIIEVKHPSCLKKIISECPSPIKSCITKTKGVIPADALIELLQLDARNKGNVISYVIQFTSNIKDVLVQLSDLYREMDLKTGLQHDKFKHRLLTILKLLRKAQRNSC